MTRTVVFSVFAHAAVLLLVSHIPLAGVTHPVYESAVIVYLNGDVARGMGGEHKALKAEAAKQAPAAPVSPPAEQALKPKEQREAAASSPEPVYTEAGHEDARAVVIQAGSYGGESKAAKVPGQQTASKGMAGGTPDGSGDLRPGGVDYEKIRAAIGGRLAYPPGARKRGFQGTVVAGFSVDGQGRAVRIRVINSSGHGVLDRAAVRTIKRAGPYPRFQDTVTVPITFRLFDAPGSTR